MLDVYRAAVTLPRYPSCTALETDSQGAIVCGADDTGAAASTNTGSLQAGFDSRYVRRSGGNMTGGLLIRNGNPAASIDAGLLLEVVGTASGRTLHAQDQLRSSGSLVAEGAVTFASLASCENIQSATNGALSCNTTDYLTEAELDSVSELETQVGGVNILLSTEVDTEAELETLLSDVTDVFTNNDGALSDDNLANNTLDDLSQTSLTDPNADRIVFWDDSDSQYEFLTPGTNLTITGNTIDATDTNTTYTAAQGLTLLAGNSFRVNSTLTGTTLRFQSLSGGTLTVSSLKNCNTLDTDGNGLVSCGTDETGGGGSSNTGALMTVFDARYVNTSGDTMTGALSIKKIGPSTGSTLIVDTKGLVYDATNKRVGIGTASPSQALQLGANTSATSPAALFLSEYGTSAGGRPQIIGNWNNSNHWGIGGHNSLNVLHIGNVTSGAWGSAQNLTLYVPNASGSSLHAEVGLSSSGSLTWEGTASGSRLVVSGEFSGAGLVDCDTAGTSKLLWDATTKRFSCGTDTDTNTTYTAAQGVTLLSGNSFRVNSTITGSLVNFQTVSGASVLAKNQLRSSGSLSVDGAAVLKSTLSVAGNAAFDTNTLFVDSSANRVGVLTTAPEAAFEVAGTMSGNALTISSLKSCDTIDTDANGVLTCGTDASGGGGGGGSSNTGALMGVFDNRYLRRSGGSATGGIIITNGNPAATIDNNLLLEIVGTASGRNIHAQTGLSSSGSLTWEGTASGAILVVSGQFSGAGLSDCDDALNNKLLWDHTTKRFSCATDQDTAGSGTTHWLDGGSFLYPADNSGVEDVIIGGTTKATADIILGSGGSAIFNKQRTGSGEFVISTQEYPRTFVVNKDGEVIFNDDPVLGVGHIIRGSGASIFNQVGSALLDTFFQTDSSVGLMVDASQDSVGINKFLPLDSMYWLNVGGRARFDDTSVVLDGLTVGDDVITEDSSYVTLRLTGSGNDLGAKFLWADSNDIKWYWTYLESDNSLTLTDEQGSTDFDVLKFTKDNRLVEIIGTGSGRDLHAQNGLTSSGNLVWEGTASGAKLSGAGLVDCDNATGSKLLWDATTKTFSCGTDQDTGGGGGISQTAGDVRYVNVSGDTMTGALGIRSGNGTVTVDSTVLLEVLGTMSGRTLHAQDELRSSGSLVVDGATVVLGHSSFNSCTALETVNGALTCGSDDTGASAYTAGQGLSLNGSNAFSLSATISGSLLEFQTVSGATVYAAQSLRSSGSLVWEGAASGATLVVSAQFSGAGLSDCDDGSTSKLLWDATTRRFSCGTDQNSGGSAYTAGQGLTLNGSNAFSLTAAHSGTTIEATQLLSGAELHAQNLLTASGQVVIDSTAAGSAYAMILNITNAGAEFLRLRQADGQDAVAIGTDSGDAGMLDIYDNNGAQKIHMTGLTGDAFFNHAGDVGINTNDPDVPGAGLEVVGVASGAYVYGNRGLSTSGSLVWEGAASGATLVVSGEFSGAGLADCDTSDTSKLLWDATTKRFSCGTDQAGGGGSAFTSTGSLQAGFDNRYVRRSGGNMTGGLLIQGLASGTPASLDAGLLLEVVGTMSGRGVAAQDYLASSGSLVVKKYAGTATGTIFRVDTRGLVYDATNKRVGVNTASPSERLHVSGSVLLENNQALKFKNAAGTSRSVFQYLSDNRLYITVQDTGIIFRTGASGQFDSTLDSSGRWGLGTSAPGSRLAVSGSVVVNPTGTAGLTAQAGTALEIIGMASGRVLRAQDTLASSGTLVWEGAASGSTLTVSGSFDGSGLTDCDTADTSKLLWDATAKRFSCGTDQAGAGGGLSQTAADARYVNVSGDTMTGAIGIRSGNGTVAVDAGVLLEALGTMSGRGLTVNGNSTFNTAADFLVKSGLLNTNSFWISHGASQNDFRLYNEAGEQALSLSANNGGTTTLALNIDNEQTAFQFTDTPGFNEFSFYDTDTNSVLEIDGDSASHAFFLYADPGQGAQDFVMIGSGSLTGNNAYLIVDAGGNVGLRTTSPETTLEVVGSASGRVLHAQDLLRSSGSLTVDGGFWQDGFSDCDGATAKVTWNLTDGKYGCGADDDAPESGDFAAAGDLDADGTITDGVIDKADFSASTDFGEISSDGSSNLTIDADVIGQSEVNDDALDFAEFQDGLDVDASTTVTLGGNNLTFIATSTGELEVIGTASGRQLHAQDQLRSSGSLSVQGAAALKSTLGVTGLVTLTDDLAVNGGNINFGTSTTIGDGGDQITLDSNGVLIISDNVSVNDEVRHASNALLQLKFVNAGGGNNRVGLGAAVDDAMDLMVYENRSVGIGTLSTAPDAKLEVVGVMSGVALHAQDLLRSSGALIVEGNATIHGTLSLTNALTVANGGTALTSLPTRSIILSAGGAKPSTLSGAVTKSLNFNTNNVDLYAQAFGNTASPRYAQWTATMPDNYNGGTLTAVFYWSSTTTSGDVKWQIQCTSYGDGEAIDATWGTAQSATDTAQASGNKVLVTSATSAITCAGTPSGGEVIQFRAFRNPADGSDTMAGTGNLISVKLEYATSSYTD